MRTLISIALVLTSLLSFTADAKTDFVAGTHYFELGNEVSKTSQVVEYFSFYCPACYRAEPLMAQIKSWLPKPELFSKNHVDNMPGRDPKIELILSQALITAKLLNADNKIVPAIFDYIHKSRSTFNNIADIKSLFLLNNITEHDFDKTFNSFKVKTEAKKMQTNTVKLRKAGYSSVPTLLINNNYIPNTKNIKSMDEYRALIQFLIAKTI